ncbi:alpha/beta fold hydrolase [Streptomyces sp. NPDC006551]|uniref:alpha/beta fold hydrolase n=1 Tax=Streptomyces sp. NPDC006551 TaxID=3157178 RepID=UPI0033B8A929
MTAFVLVSDIWTGGWVWREVAARLREAGAEAHPVTLTGMGDGGPPAGPDTDLETHVQDLVRLIDRVDAEELVLVGHGYGIHPVLGAADRRAERIARIVHLDAGLPQNGDAPLALVPDPAVHERLTRPPRRAGENESQKHAAGDARDVRPAAQKHAAGDAPDERPATHANAAGEKPAERHTPDENGEEDWRVPPPPPGAWERLGSLAGVTADASARLARLAAPQPAGTLTRPLRLTGKAATVPTTGILCTGNGSSIAMVEGLVSLGDPRLRRLTDPAVSFFELHTGHWPMLSVPDELADVLLRAAAGEGHRLAAAVREDPAHLRPFLIDLPERRRERVGQLDLYLPDADEPRPAVVFVHGGPVPLGVLPTPRDWPGFVGYGTYAAGRGVVGVTLDHGLHDLDDYPRAAGDIDAAVERVRADPRVDGERVALWFFSAGGLLSADWLAAPPSWLRCVAATYPVLAPLPQWGHSASRFLPAAALPAAGSLPVVVTRVERERAEIAVTVEEFLTAAADCDARIEVIDVPGAHHGFETIDHTDPARRAVDRAMTSVVGHLLG